MTQQPKAGPSSALAINEPTTLPPSVAEASPPKEKEKKRKRKPEVSTIEYGDVSMAVTLDEDAERAERKKRKKEKKALQEAAETTDAVGEDEARREKKRLKKEKKARESTGGE